MEILFEAACASMVDVRSCWIVFGSKINLPLTVFSPLSVTETWFVFILQLSIGFGLVSLDGGAFDGA